MYAMTPRNASVQFSALKMNNRIPEISPDGMIQQAFPAKGGQLCMKNSAGCGRLTLKGSIIAVVRVSKAQSSSYGSSVGNVQERHFRSFSRNGKCLRWPAYVSEIAVGSMYYFINPRGSRKKRV